MAFSNDSRYLLTDVVEVRSPATNELTQRPFVDLRQRVTETAPDDRAILYDTVDSWAGLSLAYLFDARSWWAIADLSGVIDPFTELAEGAQFTVPSATRLQLEILPSDRGTVS